MFGWPPESVRICVNQALCFNDLPICFWQDFTNSLCSQVHTCVHGPPTPKVLHQVLHQVALMLLWMGLWWIGARYEVDCQLPATDVTSVYCSLSVFWVLLCRCAYVSVHVCINHEHTYNISHTYVRAYVGVYVHMCVCVSLCASPSAPPSWPWRSRQDYHPVQVEARRNSYDHPDHRWAWSMCWWRHSLSVSSILCTSVRCWPAVLALVTPCAWQCIAHPCTQVVQYICM